jgi:hypothetical protein
MMADRYASSRDGYVERRYDDVEVLPRFFHPRSAAPELRRYAIVQRGGRFVIEEL